MAKRIISISIEGTTLRIIGSRGDSVEVWETVPFNPRFLKNDHIVDPAGLGEVLKNALTKMKLTGGTTLCALSAVGSTPRILDLPSMIEKGQLGSIVDREARRLAGDELALMGGTDNIEVVRNGTNESIVKDIVEKL